MLLLVILEPTLYSISYLRPHHWCSKKHIEQSTVPFPRVVFLIAHRSLRQLKKNQQCIKHCTSKTLVHRYEIAPYTYTTVNPGMSAISAIPEEFESCVTTLQPEYLRR